MSSEWQACPVCKGSRFVSRPPGVPADAESFSSTRSGPWPCSVCDGSGILKKPADDKFDDVIGDVWAKAVKLLGTVISEGPKKK